MFQITPSPRVRPSPFFEATLSAGVTGFNPYNRMLMPTGYGNPEAEYDRLLNGVTQWDVGCERQVELVGPDAARLAQILSPRDLSKCKVGQSKYVAMCNHAGTLINDPIVLKLAEDRWWMSIADSNMLFWARAVAAERGLDVRVFEPDVSPLAVQGPKAVDVVASMFGDWVRDLKYFWFRETEIEGIPVVVARSGYSKQGGYEIYLADGSKGTALWNLVAEAGKPWGIGPGNPNPSERIESGLLSYGGDTDDETNPFEVRLEKYVDLDVPDEVIGIQALRRIHAEGPKRHQLGLVLEGSGQGHHLPWEWSPIQMDGRAIGHMTNCVWSPRLGRDIGFALVSREAEIGSEVEMLSAMGRRSGQLVDLPFT